MLFAPMQRYQRRPQLYRCIQFDVRNKKLLLTKNEGRFKTFFSLQWGCPPPNGIELYTFPNGQKKCSPGKIYENLVDIIKKYFQANNINNISSEHASALLTEKIQYTVLDVQNKFFSSRKKLLKTIAKDEARIKIQDIKNLFCNPNVVAISDENFCPYTKQKFKEYLISTFEAEDPSAPNYESIKEKVTLILYEIGAIPPEKWHAFLQRLSPNIKVGIDNITSTISSVQVEALYDIAKQTNTDKITNELYLVNTEQTSLSTIKDSNINRICYQIHKNRHNLDCIYELRWSVATIPQKIENIEDKFKSITKVDDNGNHEKSIFNPKKYGLLCVGDYQNGNN